MHCIASREDDCIGPSQGSSVYLVEFGTIPYRIPFLMPKITVDGRVIDAKQGQMVLQACNDAGLHIPQYCYHPGLSIVASCRICLVEVEGIPKLVPACQTPV